MKEPVVDPVFTFGDAPSEIYTKENFRFWCKHQDTAIAQRLAKDKPVPMIAKDGPPFLDNNGKEQRGHKMYASCSWMNMYNIITRTQPSMRCFYEMVYYDAKEGKGDPVNIYMDVDLDLDKYDGEVPATLLDDIYDEVLTCIELAIEELVEHKANGWTTAWKRDDLIVKVLEADIPDVKISRHFIIRFPELAMIRDVMHMKSFIAMVFAIHYKRIDYDKGKSCFYFMHNVDKEYRPIIDVSVYSKMRVFRMIGCVKRRIDPTAGKWPLAPPCTHEGSCEDAACFYRHLKKLDVTEFLSTLITFVPPNEDGTPRDIPLLDVPFITPPWLKHTNPCKDATHGRRHGPLRVGPSPFGKDTNSVLQRTHINIDARPPLDDLFGVVHDEEPEAKRVKISPVPTLVGLMKDISYAIETQTGDRCTLYEYRIRDTGSAIVQSDSKSCPYACREHRSNHISYIVRLGYPYPTVFIKCTDPDCESDVATERVKRIYLEPDKSLFASVKRDTLAYFNAQFITAKMLCLNAK